MSKAHRNLSLELSSNVQHEKILTGSDKKLNNRKDVARRRWGILAKALKSPISSQPSSPTDEISMRRFSTFMLLTTQQIPDDSHLNHINGDLYENIKNERRKQRAYTKRTWYRYTANINSDIYSVDVGHTARSFTAVDLMGFNNTGNVCVWPSEEALAYYCLHNLEQFKQKTILELGAGMSALAGLLIAKYADTKFVHLTDGNGLAVDNIKNSVDRNRFETLVTADVLQWGTNDDQVIYDVILSADCLFFDEARNDLIETIWRSLSDTGIAYVMAPKRGETLNIFVDHAAMRGFYCKKTVLYNEQVWNRHLECLDNPDYDDDIHYPILIFLTKFN